MTVLPEIEPRGNRRLQLAARIGLGLAVLALGLYTLHNFLSAIAWAGIFAIALWPLYHRAEKRFGAGRRLLLPLLFTLAIALVFILPLGIAGLQLAHESDDVADWLQAAQQYGIQEPDFLQHLPFGQAQLDTWWQQNLADPQSAKELVQRSTRGHVADLGRIIAAQLGRRLTVFVFTLMTLFFLFREGHLLGEQVRRAARRSLGPGGERIVRQIVISIHGTVNGLVLVGLGEGLALGVVYAIAGVPEAALFGLLTAIAATIPFGAPLIFFSTALLLVASGSIFWAIVVVCSGIAVTFAADHLIRPSLIGGATQIPFILVLIGILGGVEVWGLIGLFLGPAIMAVLILLWREWAGDEPAETQTS